MYLLSSDQSDLSLPFSCSDIASSPRKPTYDTPIGSNYGYVPTPTPVTTCTSTPTSPTCFKRHSLGTFSVTWELLYVQEIGWASWDPSIQVLATHYFSRGDQHFTLAAMMEYIAKTKNLVAISWCLVVLMSLFMMTAAQACLLDASAVTNVLLYVTVLSTLHSDFQLFNDIIIIN